MTLPYLSIIVFSPVVAAIVIMFLPKERHFAIKMVALIAASISLAFSILVYIGYDQGAAGLQFVEKLPWIPNLGVSYFVAADGISLPMLLLTGFVVFTGVLVSWNVKDRPKEYFALLLTLVTGVFGVFVAWDLFVLLLFYELAVFPMYLLIGVWGSTRKEYAAMKLTLYILIGSFFALVGILAMYFSSGLNTFDMVELGKHSFDPNFQRLFFLPIFLGFGVLAGIWPFHTWSPDGHVAAPTAVSMLHAGVLMKLGAYGALRVGVSLLPDGARELLPWVVVLTVINVVYGSMVALRQRDFKYVIGYSSVSHMGFVSMGVATMTVIGMNGAVMQMFSHGIMTALFFAVVGVVYDRTHTRDIPQLGGLVKKMPWVAIAFMVGGFASMGMPGLSGFIAEFQIFVGTWQAYPVIAVLSGIGVVVTGAYILRVIQRVFFGELDAKFAEVTGATRLDKTAMFILCAILLVVGLVPAVMVDLVTTGVAPIVARLGGM